MSYSDENNLQKRARELADAEEEIHELTSKFGLEPYPVENWLIDYDEMNKVGAYGGFQERYPHWRWGMKYDQMSKKSKYMNSAPYELVINSDPSHAYLQESNDEVIQKLVMAHVDGHSDFFAKNSWFKMLTDADSAVEKLSEHADRIKSYMENPEIDREDVEKWIDSVLTVEFNINQHKPDYYQDALEEIDRKEEKELKKVLSDKGFDPDVVDHVFRNSEQGVRERNEVPDSQNKKDILRYLEKNGKSYDTEKEMAVEMEDWQRDIIGMIREESYYFAPQMMTKTMNEGWAAYWHTKVMSGENFADDDEFIEFATTQSKVLSGGGMNPYKVGKELWEYVENDANRREVYSKILKVEGINPENVGEKVDFRKVIDQLSYDDVLELDYENAKNLFDRPELTDEEKTRKVRKFRELKERIENGEDLSSEQAVEFLEDALEPDEIEVVQSYTEGNLDPEKMESMEKKVLDLDENPWKILNFEGLATRHYSLLNDHGKDFLESVPEEELRSIGGSEVSEYSGIEEALENVDMTAGWKKMYEVRENYNDALFVNEFMTQEFVDRNNYFSYENLSDGQNSMPVATSTDAKDIKKKFLLKTVNFGKPNVKVGSGNYNNRGELLLEHDYNGIEMDFGQAAHTLKFLHNLWGRDVHLKTIMKERDEEYQKKVQNLFQAMSMAAQTGGSVEDIEIPEPDEKGFLISFDGENLSTKELDWEDVEHLSSEDVDYETLPEEWLI